MFGRSGDIHFEQTRFQADWPSLEDCSGIQIGVFKFIVSFICFVVHGWRVSGDFAWG